MAIYTDQEQDGNLIDSFSAKKELIKNIKIIIKKYGAFGVAQVDAESSPFLEDTKGNLSHLIEYFKVDSVDVEVYAIHIEDSIDTYTLCYEGLSEANLAEILDLCERYEEIQTEE